MQGFNLTHGILGALACCFVSIWSEEHLVAPHNRVLLLIQGKQDTITMTALTADHGK